MRPYTRLLVVASLLTSVVWCAGVVRAAPVHDARRNWLQEQSAFVAAWRETPSLGESVSHEAQHWLAFLNALAAYMRDGNVWQTNATLLQHVLNSSSTVMGYTVQGWVTPVGRFRLITAGDNRQDISCGLGMAGDFYEAELLAWVSPNGVSHSQLMLQSTPSSPPVISNAIIPGGDAVRVNAVVDLRAWRSAHGGLRFAVVEQSTCTNYNHVAAGGAALAPNGQTWMPDHGMFPPDLEGGAQLFDDFISFANQQGTVIRIVGLLANNVIDECHACEHLIGYRLLTRSLGDMYQGGDWQIVPGPYFTLIQAIARARTVQKGGVVAECSSGTLDGLVSSSQVNDAFCATNWTKPVMVNGSTPSNDSVGSISNAVPQYKHVPVTYALSVGGGGVRVTVSPVGNMWLITQVQGKAD